MRVFVIPAALLISVSAFAATPARQLWDELKIKREKLVGLHQEFDVTQTQKSPTLERSSKHQVVVDISGGKWREKTVMGSGNHIAFFDGENTFQIEDGGNEFIPVKHRGKEDEPAPGMYRSDHVDWSKAIEVERRQCGLTGKSDMCVVLQAPVNPWIHTIPPNYVIKMHEGLEQMSIDLETGLLLTLRKIEMIENKNGDYKSTTIFVLKRMTYGSTPDESLFKLPSEGMKEVKEFSRWNAPRIKKQLAGKAAPELTLKDIEGRPVTLADLKGKTVLLDFWTTWCPPCRADAPSLDKLYRKYGEKDLMIIGISVNEERAIVERFLKEHPHPFPIALTSENELPRPFQIGTFPTYVVIDRDGTISAAVQGEHGFAELRDLLKKAGLESE
jgi:thiol-disulfide isomerase/thioredoxin